MKKGGVAIVVVIILVLFGLLGCGVLGFFVYNNYVRDKVGENIAENVIEESLEQGSGADVDVNIDDNGGSVTIEDDDSSMQITSDEEWPSNLPSSVPEFTYGKQVSSTYISGEYGEGWTIAFEENSSDAYTSYKTDLEQNNWTIGTTIESGGVYMLSATKDNMTLSLNHNTAEDTLVITVGVD